MYVERKTQKRTGGEDIGVKVKEKKPKGQDKPERRGKVKRVIIMLLIVTMPSFAYAIDCDKI